MGSYSYTFKWENPTAADPSDVLVTGSFDGWTKSVQLEKVRGVFQKSVQISEKDAANKIYYKFVVDNNWTINELYPHEPDHEGNVNNFLTPEDLDKPTSISGSGLVTAPFINTVSSESLPTTEMGKKNSKKTKAGSNKQPATESGAAPAPEVADTNEAIATPSDVPGGFPITPSNENADLGDKTVSVNPLPATVGLGNPVELAPGEKIPDSITAQDINKYVKLDKDSYEKSDALPTAPVSSTAVPPVIGTMIPESSLPMGDYNIDFSDPTINSVGPGSTTATLAGQVPLQAKVPNIVKESQDKAGVAPEASAVSDEVQEKAKAEEEEIKSKVPEAPATSVGTAGGPEKKEKSGTGLGAASAGGAAVAAATETNNNRPVAAQNAAETKETATPVKKMSPQVPTEVKESIVKADKSPEAAASTSAVSDKKAVESELLKEVKETPAASDAVKSTAAESTPVAVKAVDEKSANTKSATATTSATTSAAPATAATTTTSITANANDSGSKAAESASTPAVAANGNGSESKASGSITGDKKKGRLSVMFGKLKAKLK